MKVLLVVLCSFHHQLNIDVHESDRKPFLHIQFDGLDTALNVKNLDVNFFFGLSNFVIHHRQFMDEDQKPLRLISARSQTDDSIHGNPVLWFSLYHRSEKTLASSLDPDAPENELKLDIERLTIIFKAEALQSIAAFHDKLLNIVGRNFPMIGPTAILENQVQQFLSTKTSESKDSFFKHYKHLSCI